jgi:phosphatidylserine decarboxylase
MKPWLACIEQLKNILETRPDLMSSLESAIQRASFPEITNLSEYFQLLTGLLTHIPTMREMNPATEKFHYIVNCSPGDLLQTDETFQQWLVAFSKDHGSFLDTTESAEGLDTFINDPSFKIEDYYRGPSGWLTFNQFFARSVKPGKRPVDAPCNDNFIVSAADSKYLGCWSINGQARLAVKGETYSISQLLAGSPYSDRFSGGLFTHSYLDTTDYHRYHTPVCGIVKEARVIPGRAFVDEVKANGKLTTRDDVGFQFRQTRGILILESPIGYVAAIPVGMGHVSSVNITAEMGSSLSKGQEFGYFGYGGSDMVLLFEQQIKFTAKTDTHYQQGQALAHARQGKDLQSRV